MEVDKQKQKVSMIKNITLHKVNFPIIGVGIEPLIKIAIKYQNPGK